MKLKHNEIFTQPLCMIILVSKVYLKLYQTWNVFDQLCVIE